jgi:saccharopine dehydrogenase-like NADP-dependent oxidoreductase
LIKAFFKKGFYFCCYSSLSILLSMAGIKHIVLFGAGKSATVLIDYLKNIATENIWKVTVADSNLSVVKAKVGEHDLVKPVEVNIENEAQRKALITQADVVISMMPPNLHYLVALDCIELDKNLLTASYVSESINALQDQIEKKGLLFLCEMGLDPGIDHMSAMQIFHRIKEEGGKVTSFKSHCGGLVAPESDTNPWHYKISWNPRNVVLAGKAGADYIEDGKVVHLPTPNYSTQKKLLKFLSMASLLITQTVILWLTKNCTGLIISTP